MKTIKIFLVIIIGLISMNCFSQIRVTSENNLVIPESTSSIRFGNTTNGGIIKGNWGIEYYDGGLNFWRPWPNSNWSNYYLFLKDDGKVGIGAKPLYGKLEIYGEGSNEGFSIYNGSGTSFRLFRQSDIVYFTRGGSTTAGIVLTNNGHIGINRAPSNSYWLDVNGNIRVNTTVYTSDRRLKNNIHDLTNVTQNLTKLNGVSYNLKTINEQTKKDVDNNPIEEIQGKETPNETKTDDRIHFGFIAQDLQQVFPELVYEDDDGILGIDYISIIPLLVESIKQQNSKINMLEQKLKSLDYWSNIDDKESLNNLKQNSPNPFNVSTTIDYSVDESANNAYLYVYDLQGNQIDKYEINVRGQGSIEIQAGRYNPGIFVYSLIVDGQEIDTKRMILTK